MEPEVLGSRPRGGTISFFDFDTELLARLRAETPMCARLTHFNNAGMSLTPQPVLNTVMRHLGREQGMGGYRAEDHVRDRLEAGYDSLARLLGANRSEVAFMHNATRAWEIGLASFDLQPGDCIITHDSEYVSNRFKLIQLERRGVVIDRVGSRADGCVDPEAVRDAITPQTRLICLTHIPSTHGRINPVAEVGKLAREAEVPFLLDACQSAGQLALNVEAIGCDMLAGTGRKFLRGPRGTGFLYVRESLLETLRPPFPDYRSARFDGPEAIRFIEGARRFETYEHSVAAKLGFIRAIDYFLDVGPERVEARVRALSMELQAALREAGMAVLPDQTSGIVLFTHPTLTPSEVKSQLAEAGVNVSVSTREFADPAQAVRASVHYYNTLDEIATLATLLAGLVTPH